VASIFSRIIAGELPGHFVYRDETVVAFLSIGPIATGHTLVVPVAEVDHWVDLDDDTVARLTVVAKRVGRAQVAAFGAERVALIIAGLEVPHTHLHVLPIHTESDIDFKKARTDVPAEELAEVAATLAAAVEALGS
jgi:diadenosine tetraphosphate (Ap4A) HIT family hydrolase